MKLFCHGLLWIGIVSLVSVGCEPHSFEDTKVLHQGHGGGHGDGHGDEHGDDAHGKESHHEDHAKADDHHKEEAKPKADKKEANAEKKADEPREVGL